MTRNKYFTMSGMAFQATGTETETETALNVQIAMDIVKRFVTSGGSAHEAQEALAWLEDQFPKPEVCCDFFRLAFLLDDFIDHDQQKRIAIKGYNCLADRLSGTPL